MTHRTRPRYARSIGRVGGLAVALGVGIAVGHSPGVALADTRSAPDSSAGAPAKPPAKTAGKGTSARKPQRVAAGAVVGAKPSVTSHAGSIPAAPPAASLTDVLGYAGREIERHTAQRTVGSTLFARKPALAYNAAQNSQGAGGVITGTLNPSQPDGYALTYAAGTPRSGSVTIDPAGTFTYQPDPAFATLGGTDTFTVTADDRPGNPPHWHGFSGLFAPSGGHTATATVTVLENPGPAIPPSVLGTTDQLNAEQLATRLANSPLVQLAKVVLKVGWYLAARQNFDLVGGPDAANLAQLDQAVTEYATQAALEVQLLDSNNPKVIQQVAPTHDWYLQQFAGSRIWYDNPDTIYRFIGVNSASSYVITGKFTDGRPADTNFSVLTGLSGATAANLNGRDMEINADGTFTITANSAPAAPGQANHLQLVPGTTLITTRNTLSDWNTQDPMSLSVLRVSGPPPSFFSQIGGFAIPGIGPLVAGNPLLTAMFSLVPPLPAPRLVQSLETAVIMLLLGISGENQYMGVATTDPDTGERRPPNVMSDPGRNAQFLSTQLQSAGYFQLDDDEALVLTIKPGKARYFVVPVTNDWTISTDYWNEQTSLNIAQAQAGPGGTYTIVVSPRDPGVANWVSTGGLNQGTISIRFQDFDPASTTDPTVQSQVVPVSQVATLFPSGPYDRQAQIAQRQLGYNKRYAPYPQA